MELALPVIMALILICGLLRKTDIVQAFCEGAEENLRTAVSLCPMLILLLTAVGMFTDSGAADAFSGLLSPLFRMLGIPHECCTLMLIRPISGSGSLAVLESLLSKISPDSFAARTACVIMGSTETTLYTIAAYCTAAKEKPCPQMFIASFAADLTGFILAPLVTRLFFA